MQDFFHRLFKSQIRRFCLRFRLCLFHCKNINAVQEKTEKEAKQLEKEEQDRKHKNLQIEDLEFRLKTVEDMQERQKRFWAKQNISLFISGLSLIVAFIALIAKCSSKS